MMRSAIVSASMLALLVTGGCGKDGGDTEDTDVVTCTNSFTAFPAANATNVYYRSTIEAKFQTIDDAATITVDGVTGTSEWRGNTLVFTPGSALDPNTAYTAHVSFACSSDASWTFTTGEVGSAVTTDLTGKTYALDLASGRFVHPEGVGDLLQQYLTADVLIGVQSVDGTDLQMIGAIGKTDADPPEQDVCAETIPFPVADFSDNPFFQVGPATTTINVQGYSITIDDLLISGAFAPDGTYITGAVLSGKIDTRPLVPLLDENGEDDAICQLAASIGVTCEACADGTGDFCLSLYVDSINAAGISGSLEELTVDTIDCTNPDCADATACAAP
jgi:hypothetical protein